IDTDKKIDAQFEKIYNLMNDEYMVTIANLITSSSKIALAKPYLTHKITTELLKVENLATKPHLTEECKLILAEKTLETFGKFCNKMSPEDMTSVLSFAKRYRDSKRRTLSRQAETLLKKW
ncbi:MAG TPA: hypothetical protein VMD05_05520, partial [Candidatus Nanoarchaeia archaeon]|nr:hypothetical protein [Candidatus Nanoarchaeia archaeon]